MNDPYKKIFEDIVQALNKQTEIIVWIARRVLSAKEFSEFIDEFSEKHDKEVKLE